MQDSQEKAEVKPFSEGTEKLPDVDTTHFPWFCTKTAAERAAGFLDLMFKWMATLDDAVPTFEQHMEAMETQEALEAMETLASYVGGDAVQGMIAVAVEEQQEETEE